MVVHSPSLTSRFVAIKVPTKPPPNVEEVRNQFDQTLVRQLEEVGVSSSQLYAFLVNGVPTPEALPNTACLDSCLPAQPIHSGPSTRNTQVRADALYVLSNPFMYRCD